MSIISFFGPRIVAAGLIAAMGGGGYAAAAIHRGAFELALAVWPLTLVYFLLPMTKINRFIMIGIGIVFPLIVGLFRALLGDGIFDYFYLFVILGVIFYIFIGIPALYSDGELLDALSTSTSGTGRSWGQ